MSEIVKQSKKTKRTKLSEEVAQSQVDLLVEYYEINTDEKSEQGKSFCNVQEALVNAIRNGRIEVHEDSDFGLKVKQNLKFNYEWSETGVLNYAEISGKHKKHIPADSERKAKNTYIKIYSLVASMTGLEASQITSLRSVDMSNVETLGTLFLQV